MLEPQKIVRKDFQEACKPLMEYLAKNHHPHTSVIVNSTNAEINEGIMSFETDDYIMD